jgi:hypothetical protein
VVRIAQAAAIAHQAAGQNEFTVWKDRGQRIAGRQRRQLFGTPGVEGTVADQDRTNMLLRKSCEGRFEIAIGAGTAALSRIRSFFVIARMSACTYKGRRVNVREVGNQLGVAYVL